LARLDDFFPRFPLSATLIDIHPFWVSFLAVPSHFHFSAALHPIATMAATDADYKSRATSGEEAYPMQDGAKSHVSAKYLGTEGDKAQMRRLGRTQETRRVFTFITILGFGSTLIVTWEVLLTNIGLILVNGGTAGMFWGFLFVLLGWTLVYLSLSEMASM
jgi:hypothetical protein